MKGHLIVLLCIMVYIKGDEVSEVIANANNHNFRFVIFKIKDDEVTLSVEAKGNRAENIDDLIGKLPDHFPRYALLDYESNSAADGSKQQKWVIIAYVPDTSKIKQKMMYSAAFHSFKQRFAELGPFIVSESEKTVLKEHIKARVGSD